MNTNNIQGRNIVTAMGVYIILKSVLNMIIAGGLSILSLLWAVLLAVLLFMGFQYTNIGVGAVLFLGAVVNLPANISNFGSNWLYFIEGVIDIVCAVLLVTRNDIKEHFTNKWSEFGDYFKFQ
ncbi:MAG: hypothetical protein NC205_06700 [Prevotella sp.]|nr:hypothetical protein [Alistipes senegalensis]MCM1358267.1 hypothetical protein [Prevotella sp.]MCM1473091.1 hypothetical protein [Muribaculaceae bacterium]